MGGEERNDYICGNVGDYVFEMAAPRMHGGALLLTIPPTGSPTHKRRFQQHRARGSCGMVQYAWQVHQPQHKAAKVLYSVLKMEYSTY